MKFEIAIYIQNNLLVYIPREEHTTQTNIMNEFKSRHPSFWFGMIFRSLEDVKNSGNNATQGVETNHFMNV